MSHARISRVASAGSVALLVLLGSMSSAGADRGDDAVAKAQAATTNFHNVQVAEAAGYGKFADAAGLTCIEDPQGTGAMGVHYVNATLVGDDSVALDQPESVIYDLNNRLVAVEYIVFVDKWGSDRRPPVLFGQKFEKVEYPNRYGIPAFYELHAWIWNRNPNGMFADWNPKVHC